MSHGHMSTCLLQGLPTHAVKGSQGGGGGGGCTEGSSERGGGIEERQGKTSKGTPDACRSDKATHIPQQCLEQDLGTPARYRGPTHYLPPFAPAQIHTRHARLGRRRMLV